MSQDGVGQLVDRWLEDTDFRERLRTNPSDAIGSGNFDLTPEERAALAEQDWKLSDEELKERVSRGLLCAIRCH